MSCRFGEAGLVGAALTDRPSRMLVATQAEACPTQEVELKLICDAADQAVLHAWPSPSPRPGNATGTSWNPFISIRSDGLLRKSGYVLRVRKKRRRATPSRP